MFRPKPVLTPRQVTRANPRNYWFLSLRSLVNFIFLPVEVRQPLPNEIESRPKTSVLL